jgi:hypothetical protein
MKRDMELVRKILLALEEAEETTGNNPTIEGYSDDAVSAHAFLMVQAGLVGGAVVSNLESPNPEAIAYNLTWEGHEFLDLARSNTIWSKAKAKVLAATSGTGIAALKVALTELTKRALSGDS